MTHRPGQKYPCIRCGHEDRGERDSATGLCPECLRAEPGKPLTHRKYEIGGEPDKYPLPRQAR